MLRRHIADPTTTLLEIESDAVTELAPWFKLPMRRVPLSTTGESRARFLFNMEYSCLCITNLSVHHPVCPAALLTASQQPSNRRHRLRRPRSGPKAHRRRIPRQHFDTKLDHQSRLRRRIHQPMYRLHRPPGLLAVLARLPLCRNGSPETALGSQPILQDRDHGPLPRRCHRHPRCCRSTQRRLPSSLLHLWRSTRLQRQARKVHHRAARWQLPCHALERPRAQHPAHLLGLCPREPGVLHQPAQRPGRQGERLQNLRGGDQLAGQCGVVVHRHIGSSLVLWDVFDQVRAVRDM